ncbi:type IV pilin protein [Pedosphaera parvula]|uniref:Prepilin-type cleavage/methylation domain-containing protein n=1 Tax=Pedosphaera parvula (strain Ellin514) TaxID=320771 RepID=B9XG26_PEDPL|nr:prepilin-type N-terminal cleavage/methylation domain-containing protein [Pedosphaera parvula]EEF61188.1 hypothetical protein Cflav_PD3905 [Pedosphaera parvula Ellin514]
MKLTQLKKAGFTLVEIMIVVAIIGLLAAVAIPNYVHARTNAQQSGCINNLRHIDGAKQQWALETKAAATASPQLSDIQSYLGRGTNGNPPICPADSAAAFASSYAIHDLQNPPTCLINTTNHVLNLN